MTSQSKAKHTPGPWDYDEMWALIMGPNKEEVCAVHAGAGQNEPCGRQHIGIAKANARLIASAPELLAILKKMHKHFITEAEHIGEIEEALESESKAAILKAEGGK